MNGSSGELPTPFDNGEVYDLILKEIPYGFDFYTGLAKEAKGPVLDICCGTGRILLPCLQAGVDIEGLDLFAPMLDTLRQKGEALGLSPHLHQADMSDFDLPRRYALAMIPFNAVGHNMTQEAQIRCLSLCRQHLLPGGLLAFDTFFPSLAIIGTPQHTRVTAAALPRRGASCRGALSIAAACRCDGATPAAGDQRGFRREHAHRRGAVVG